MLNICYITCRKEPMIEWFFRSLERETKGDYVGIRIVVVDYHHATRRGDWAVFGQNGISVTFAPPKPCVWNGPHRLTKNDYFAAASVRNTALCYAQDGWVVFVDDLSVLMPGWLNAVRDMMKGGYIACGAYRKVYKLEMRESGEIIYEDYPSGWDHRWKSGSDQMAVPCYPDWHYGCSIAGPVNAYLKVNGFPEMCDSMGLGMEDVMTGLALGNTGHKLKYDRRMLTLESEERHHVGAKMLRVDKKLGGTVEIRPGVTHPDEKGHHLVHKLRPAKWFENDFGPHPDLAAMRQHILNGGEFPIMTTPDKDWFDGQPLSSL